MILQALALQATFSYRGTRMYLDDEEFVIRSGEMHPGRIPHQYWRHRIQMAKAMGMNSVAAYVFWNQHEVEKGKFDFASPQNDIGAFLDIAKQEGMYVLLRPGPYVCGEWDFGGLPTYLLRDPGSKIRTIKDAEYKDAVTRYVAALAPVVEKRMVYNGGSVIIVQVENEYGSWGRQERDYVDYVQQLWVDNGVTGPFFTADALAYVNDNNHPDGAAVGMDGYYSEKDFQSANEKFPTVPAMVAELYPGWLRHWYENDWSQGDITGSIAEYIKNGRGFNIYVIHGGTNFGLTAGANNNGEMIQPDLTSYDYAAPISEQGRPTDRYFKYREAVQNALGTRLPDVPEDIPTADVPAVQLSRVADVWAQEPAEVAELEEPKHFEHFGQNQNFILYEATLPAGAGGVLKFAQLRDYSKVYLNGALVATINRCKTNSYEVALPAVEAPGKLEVFVEAFGHINFNMIMETDRKGIVGEVTFDGKAVRGWTHRRYLIDAMLSSTVQEVRHPERAGGIYRGTFELAEPQDTYLEVGGLDKGYLVVNGVNLGRYWSVGPQTRLYCPATYLRSGANVVQVLEVESTAERGTVQGYSTPK